MRENKARSQAMSELQDRGFRTPNKGLPGVWTEFNGKPKEFPAPEPMPEVGGDS